MIELHTGNDFVDDFVKYVHTTLKKRKTTLSIYLGQILEIEGSKVDGYYCEDEKELAVCYDGSLDFVGILAHEFNHFQQAMAKSPKWVALDLDGSNCYELWWDWLNKNIELDEDKLEQVVRRIQDAEWECENMTIQTINKFNLPIDLENYIGTANSYIYFFQHAKNTRQWYDENEGPSDENITRYLPKTKMVDSYYHLPFGLELLF